MKEDDNLEQRSVKSRLKKFIEHLQIPQSEFEKRTGLSNGYVNNIRKSIKAEKFDESIAPVFPELNKVWLLHGIGKMLNDKGQDSAVKSFNSGRPFYDGDWELGFNESFDENLTNPEFNIDFPPANKTEGMWMRGKGKSMLGEIDPGDFIYFSPMEDFSWFPFGRIYGIVTKNKMRIVKRVVKSDTPGHYLLMSSNPDKLSYPDQEIPIDMITMMFEVKFVIKNLNE